MFKLINYEQNKNLLQKIPHIKILDLAIIFNCLVDADETGNATILIYNQHLSLWNITKDDLYHLAMKNTPALLTYELRDMSDVLIELMAGVPCDSMKEEFELHGSNVCTLQQKQAEWFRMYFLPQSAA